MKKDKSLAVAFVELTTAYVATHPHVVEDAQKYFWFYIMTVSRKLAEDFGRLAMYSELKYRS